MSKITVVYPMHNRLEYTKLTFPKVLDEVRKSEDIVGELRIYDDVSDDGSLEFVENLIQKNDFKQKIVFTRKKIGNSTFQINNTISNSNLPYIVKVDNDILIPTGYFEHLNWLMDKHLDIAFLMMPEVSDFPFIKPKSELSIKDRSHIGGVGAFRRSVFEKQGLINSEKKFFGFTAYQTRAMQELNVRACELVGSGNMNLDASPVYSRVNYYESKGWGRNMWKGVKSIMDTKK